MYSLLFSSRHEAYLLFPTLPNAHSHIIITRPRTKQKVKIDYSYLVIRVANTSTPNNLTIQNEDLVLFFSTYKLNIQHNNITSLLNTNQAIMSAINNNHQTYVEEFNDATFATEAKQYHQHASNKSSMAPPRRLIRESMQGSSRILRRVSMEGEPASKRRRSSLIRNVVQLSSQRRLSHNIMQNDDDLGNLTTQLRTLRAAASAANISHSQFSMAIQALLDNLNASSGDGSDDREAAGWSSLATIANRRGQNILVQLIQATERLVALKRRKHHW
jgi:hypothetical protein